MAYPVSFDRLVDPYRVSAGGDGLTLATAYKSLTEVPDIAGLWVGLRGDGAIHRPLAIPAAPTDVSTAPYLCKLTSGGAYRFDTYTGGDATPGLGGDPTFSGAVIWTGSVGSQSLNGLSCRTIDTGAAVSDLWPVVSKGRTTYPSMCAPGANDSTDSFIGDPSCFDQIALGQSGVRYVPPANWGGTSDASKEASYIDRGAGYSPAAERYLLQIRSPGWLARIEAAGTSIVGARLVIRTGANFTDYFCKVLTAPTGAGLITVGCANRPDDNAGNPEGFFYALIGHQYGLRQERQYAMLASGNGWVFYIGNPVPSNADLSIACYSTAFQFIGATASITFNPGKTWTFQNFIHTNSVTRGGAGIVLEQGASGLTCGPLVMKDCRNFNRDGASVKISGTGATTGTTLSSITVRGCVGTRGFEASSSGISTGLAINGPIRVDEGTNLVRLAGRVNGFTSVGGSIAPSDKVHDNGTVFGYQDARGLTISGGIISGQTNPLAAQWETVGGATYGSLFRSVSNFWFSGRPNRAGSAWASVYTLRLDDGFQDCTMDRVVALGFASYLGSGGLSHSGALFARTVIENFIYATGALTGVTFRNIVFRRSPGILATMAALPTPPTLISCVEVTGGFAGTITDPEWFALTRNSTNTGNEVVSPWFDPECPTAGGGKGLSLPAYGSPITLRGPGINAASLRRGQDIGFMVCEFIPQDPLAVMTLPSGLGDNNRVALNALTGTQVTFAVACPNQANLTLVVRETYAGATNGPSQDFTFIIPIEQYLPRSIWPRVMQVKDAVGATATLLGNLVLND